MSYCFIDQPYSYSWITGAYGFLRVYAYNDSGGIADLTAQCARTTDTPTSKHDMDKLSFPHDPYVVWIVTYYLNHKSYGYSTRHTLTATLYDATGGYLDSSAVVGVGVTPPDAADDMHGDPKDKVETSDEHWLAKRADAEALLPVSALTDGYLPTDGAKKLGGVVPKTVKALQVTAELCLPRYGGPDDLPARRLLLSTTTVAAGGAWELALRAEDVVHGAVVMLSFTNPDEKSARRKTVNFPVYVFDKSRRVEVPDDGRHKGHKGKPPLAFKLTR